MSDILFGNNNKKVIKTIADRSYKNQRQRNLFIILAIIITTFMLVTTISMGLSYRETYTDNTAKAMGTTAHFALTNSSVGQIESLKEQDLGIENVGTQIVVGSVTNDAKLGLVWIDNTEWESHRIPTIDDIYGAYPTAENEIMLPTWAIENIGITEPTLGMDIPITYRLNGELEDTTQTFILSGYYTDYLQTRTGDRGVAYISDEFLKTAQNVEVTAMVSLQNPNDIDNVTEKIARELGLTSNQDISVVPALSQNEAVTYLSIALIVLIVITAYLLIYNVLYISISKDIAHYGQLKTLGTTKRQIEKIIYSQVIKLSFIGIAVGLILGTLTSFVIVPLTMNFFFAGEVKTVISFSPYVYIVAAAFSFLTVMVGSFTPAKIAGKISPIEAAKYTDYKGSKQKHSKKIHIFSLSVRNVFRNKKGAFYTFTSLILGLTTFMLVSVLTTSMNPKVMIENEGDADFTIQFLDAALVNEGLIDRAANIDGIENFTTSNRGEIEIIYDEAVFGNYLQSFDGEKGFRLDDEDFIKTYTANFYATVYGIDSQRIEMLNQTLQEPIDIQAFENGEFVLLQDIPQLPNGENIFNAGDTFTDVGGTHTFVIGNAFVDENFNDLPDNLRLNAPTLFVSKNFLAQIAIDSGISSIKFDAGETDDSVILQEVEQIFGDDPNILIESRYQRIAEMAGYVAIIEIVGSSISFIFMLIGILNFINTIAVGVTVRTHELALLESVGMTSRQVKRMLSLEGLFYWVIPFGFVFTVGNGLLYLIYESLKENAILSVFSYPTVTMSAVAVLLLVICLYLPVFIYKLSLKGSITKRLGAVAR